MEAGAASEARRVASTAACPGIPSMSVPRHAGHVSLHPGGIVGSILPENHHLKLKK